MVSSVDSQSCLDASGNEVDWWLAMKFPSGFLYSHLTPNSPASTWEQTIFDLQKTAGPVYNTLQQIYAGSVPTYAMYNDQLPDGNVSFSFGHSKGFAGMGMNGKGFFVTHSIPKFPPVFSDGYGIGNNAYTYGQSLLCVSISDTTLNSIAGGWFYTFPQFYSSSVASGHGSVLNNLVQAIGGNKITTASSSSLAITTLGGVSFTYLVKTGKWGKDIYEYLVSPYYNSGLIAETWQYGTNPLDSWCSLDGTYPYTVYNANDLALASKQWTIMNDHSKWCVTLPTAGSTRAICVGDINRVATQYSRSGGMLCTSQRSDIYAAMFNMISTYENCTGNTIMAVGNLTKGASITPGLLTGTSNNNNNNNNTSTSKDIIDDNVLKSKAFVIGISVGSVVVAASVTTTIALAIYRQILKKRAHRIKEVSLEQL